jgi:peptidoglycan hydrolase FlgJ
MSIANTIPAQQAAKAYAAAGGAAPQSREGKARKAADNFESVFLQNMIDSMMSGVGKEGPLGSGEGGGAWRGFLTEEVAKGMSRKGTLGIAPQVYREMLKLQER